MAGGGDAAASTEKPGGKKTPPEKKGKKTQPEKTTEDTQPVMPVRPTAVAAARTPISPPRFFEEDPVIWLVQLDLYFCQIGDEDQTSRFRIAATLLPGHLLRDFADILRNPPDDEPYTVLSQAIQQRFGKSVEQRLRSLLSDQQLGDRRPSQFLRHLLDLAEAEGSQQDSPLVRQIFFNAMPPKIQPFLQCLPQGTDLATLASTADRLLELPTSGSTAVHAVSTAPAATSPAVQPTPAVHAVHSTSPASPTEDLPAMMRQLITGVTALTTTVSSLVEVTARRERASSVDHRERRHRERSATPRARDPEPAAALCWYHRKYGSNARTCQPPCSWTSGNAS